MDKCLDSPGYELTSPRTGLIYQSLGKKPILHKEVRVIWVRKEQVKGMRLPFGRHVGALEGGALLLLPGLASTRRAGAPCPSADRELLGGRREPRPIHSCVPGVSKVPGTQQVLNKCLVNK